jgi:hypothetical protein
MTASISLPIPLQQDSPFDGGLNPFSTASVKGLAANLGRPSPNARRFESGPYQHLVSVLQAAFVEHECIDKYWKVFRYAKSKASAPDGTLDHAEIGM